MKQSVASWDGREQNSGLIAIDSAFNGVITPHARDRYNALNVGAPLDQGVSATATNTFLIDAEHLARFAELRDRARQQGK